MRAQESARPLHVALVHGSFPPVERFGGIVRYLVGLAGGLSELGHRVTVITRDDDGPRLDHIDGYEVIRVAVSKPFGETRVGRVSDAAVASRAFARALRAAHAQNPVDVVEFSNYRGEGTVHAFRKTVPHVTRVVTMDWQSQEIANEDGREHRALGDPWRNWFEAVGIRRSNLVLTPSLAHSSVVSRRYAGVRPVTVPLGVSAAPSELPGTLSSDEVRFLYVGKRAARKGYDTLLRAFGAVHAELPSSRLEIVGDDDALPEESRSGDAALAAVPPAAREAVSLVGWLADAELARRYAACDVFVAPSRYESFGLIYLEAMRAAKPVIACDVGGAPEIVSDGETGRLVPPGDAGELAAAMAALGRDPGLRSQLGRAGFERWSGEFTQARMAERTIDAYRRLLDGRPSSSSG